MTVGTRIIAGAKLAQKGFVFTLKNKKLMFYTVLPILMFIITGISYLVPMVTKLLQLKDQLASGDVTQLIMALMSTPEIFVPSLITKLLLIASFILIVLAFAAITYRTAQKIAGSRFAAPMSSVLSRNWLALVLWSGVTLALSFAKQLRIFGTNEIINTVVSLVLTVVTVLLMFTICYIVLRNRSIIDAMLSSIKLAWKNIAPIFGYIVWFIVLLTAFIMALILPAAILYALLPSWWKVIPAVIGVLAGIFWFLFIITLSATSSVVFFLWTHDELPSL